MQNFFHWGVSRGGLVSSRLSYIDRKKRGETADIAGGYTKGMLVKESQEDRRTRRRLENMSGLFTGAQTASEGNAVQFDLVQRYGAGNPPTALATRGDHEKEKKQKWDRA